LKGGIYKKKMKILSILMALVLAISLVGMIQAAYGNVDANLEVTTGNSQANINANAEANASRNNEGIGQELSSEIKVKQEELREGTYIGPFGLALNVRVMSAELRELKEGNVSVKTEINLTIETDEKNKTHIKAHFKDNTESEIKIMSITASETALARLRLKVCSLENNCTIELKEVGAKANYELKADQKVKVLGLFNAKMHVESQVSAETGEIISAKVPWWVSISATA